MVEYRKCLEQCNEDAPAREGEGFNARMKRLRGCGNDCWENAKLSLDLCREHASENCEEYCSKNYEHSIWDGDSDWPDCGCICEKGWEMRFEGCVPCDVICKEKGDHFVYDADKSYDNACECKCEDGYENDYYIEKCKKVECPPNSTNVADLAGSCPKDRKLNRHCCCDEGYINYMNEGVCIKKEDVPGTVDEEDKYVIKPNRNSCKDFDVDPKDFDLAYDRWMLRHEFENFLVEYSSTHTLKKGSSKFKSISWLDFFFHLGFTDDENFLTGKENDLRMKIQERAQKKNENLTPVQVFEESLKLNNNYVFEALLTSHNLLRNHTNKHRAEAKYREQLTKAESNLRNATTPQEKKNAKRNLKQIKEELMKNKNVFGALKEIRESDNVGAWYHLFGTMSAGYAYPYLGRAAVRGEPIYRWLYEKPQDNLEQCWNVWGAYIGSLIAEMSIIKDEKLVDSGLTNANPATIKAGYNGMKLKGGPQ